MASIWNDLLGSTVRFVGRKYQTRIVEAGEGRPLVLIHGIGGHAEAYSRNLMRLAAHCHPIAIDLLWHGLSSKPPFADTMPAYAEQVIDLMDAMKLERIFLEGESLGGWLALWMALHHADRLAGIVLNTAAGVRFRPGAVAERPQEGRELLRQRFYTDPATRVALKAIFNDAFSAGGLFDRFAIPEERLAEIKTPTLVFWTDKNPGTGPDVGQRMANLIPGAKFYCMNDAAHWPQWEHPEEHDRVILDFLDQAGR